MRSLNSKRATCSERCRAARCYYRRHAEAFKPAPRGRPMLEPLGSEMQPAAVRRIEASLAFWEAYHRRARTHTIDAWAGYTVRYER